MPSTTLGDWWDCTAWAYGLVWDLVKKIRSLQRRRKSISTGKMGFSTIMREIYSGGMSEGFPENMMTVEMFEIGNEHDQVCRTYWEYLSFLFLKAIYVYCCILEK